MYTIDTLNYSVLLLSIDGGTCLLHSLDAYVVITIIINIILLLVFIDAFNW